MKPKAANAAVPATSAEKNKDRLSKAREERENRKEAWIDGLDNEQLVVELKRKGLPTFGTRPQRALRLKQAHGLNPVRRADEENGAPPAPAAVVAPAVLIEEEKNKRQSAGAAAVPAKKGSVLEEIERLKKKREDRRIQMEDARKARAAEEANNEAYGRGGDVDFSRMIAKYRKDDLPAPHPHTQQSHSKICVCVRKRPIFSKELNAKEIDAVSLTNPFAIVHECKLKVDGITKYLENHQFAFDQTFDDQSQTEDLYVSCVQPLVPFVLKRGKATCFAYGQTGSGKTYTMRGVQQMVATDLFSLAASPEYRDRNFVFSVTFFELYGGHVYDLLNRRQRLLVMEDGNQKVQIAGLEERVVTSEDEMLELIEYGNSVRTTHATSANDDSSRSHAVCQVLLREGDSNKIYSKFSLVDLAGSERGQDTKSHNRQRRVEGAEINKSLLALKECIRALDSRQDGGHVPFRASKLTLVLRDSFVGRNTRTVMISCVSPGSSSADHTLNTLRYADRLKERQVSDVGDAQAAIADYNGENYEEEPVVDAPGAVNDTRFEDEHEKALKAGVGKLRAEREKRRKLAEKAKVEAEERERMLVQHGGGELEHDGDEDDGYDEDHHGNAEEDERVLRRSLKDIEYLHQTLRAENGGHNSQELMQFQVAVDTIVQEEERVLAAHMNAIQEDAQMLTEEGELLSRVQGEGVVDYDIDEYVERLDEILTNKISLYQDLQARLHTFRDHLNQEEQASQMVQAKGVF